MTIPRLHLSRVRLRSGRGEVLSAVAPLLIPIEPTQRPGHAHRVLWMLFQETLDSKRDFLWREEDAGRFLVLSQREPSDPHNLFEIDTKPFEPQLEPGDRLRFALRANPVRATKAKAANPQPGRTGNARGKRVDVVMHALHAVPRTNWRERTGRAFERDGIAAQACRDWLHSQAGKSGVRVVGETEVAGYVQVALERRRGRPAGFSQVDLSGNLEVIDPAAFLAKLTSGFGSAKAFGCGLMLIRRSPPS